MFLTVPGQQQRSVALQHEPHDYTDKTFLFTGPGTEDRILCLQCNFKSYVHVLPCSLQSAVL